MKIVILDGYALNPGDLSYEPLRQFGELTIYDRTDTEDEAIARIKRVACPANGRRLNTNTPFALTG